MLSRKRPQKIGKGEYDVEIPVHRSDEIGELAKSFSDMAENLKIRTAELETANLSLQEEMRVRREAEAQLLQRQKMESIGH